MTRLHVTDLPEVLSHMPIARPAKEVVNSPVDLLLCASGFEPRTTAVPEYLLREGVDVSRVRYFSYRDNEEQNRNRRRLLAKSLRQLTSDVDSIDGDASIQELRAALTNATSGLEIKRSDGVTRGPVVIFDVSAASTRLIIRVLHVLWSLRMHLVLAYAQAATYYPTAKELAAAIEGLGGPPGEFRISCESLGLDRDVRDPEYSLEYSGVQLDNLPDRVIVVAGFNGHRNKAALEFVDPALVLDHPNSRVTWLIGEPLDLEDRWRHDAMLRVNGLSGADGYADVHTTSTLDYRQTLRLLEEEYIRHFASERLTVAPMGSKLQSVGVSLFCELHPDVRVVFAMPGSHNGKHYSRGVRGIWGFEFGPTAKVRTRLESVGEAVMFD